MSGEIGLTEVSATSMEVITSIIQDVLKQESILVPTVSDWSKYAIKGASTVSPPRRTQFAAADKTENTDLSPQTITFSKDQIALNKHKAVYGLIERIAEAQATVSVDSEVVKEMAAELALQLDKDIYVQLKLASASSPDHRVAFANASSLGKADLINARKLLNIQSCKPQDRFLLVNPLHESELLAIDDFIHVDKYGATAQALSNGELGKLYGMTVLMSNVCEDNNVVVYHRSAVGYAVQLKPQFATAFLLKAVADEFLMHTLYGCKVLDSGKRQVLVGTAS